MHSSHPLSCDRWRISDSGLTFFKIYFARWASSTKRRRRHRRRLKRKAKRVEENPIDLHQNQVPEVSRRLATMVMKQNRPLCQRRKVIAREQMHAIRTFTSWNNCTKSHASGYRAETGKGLRHFVISLCVWRNWTGCVRLSVTHLNVTIIYDMWHPNGFGTYFLTVIKWPNQHTTLLWWVYDIWFDHASKILRRLTDIGRLY